MYRLATLLAVLVALTGCGTGMAVSPSPSAPASVAASSGSTSAATLTVLVFGDSWPAGDHCDGCRPWPGLYADGLESTTGRPVDLIDRTGIETAASLALTIQADPSVKADVARADVIVLSIGTNDLEPAFNAYHDGTCGGADQLDCFRAIVETLRGTFDQILTDIDGLRAGMPTAVRIVTMSNEFLSEQGAIELVGADFGASGGVAVTTMMRDMWCAAGTANGATCVELGHALNGADLLTPRDINAQDTMQLVGDTILATGLGELP